MDIKGQFERYRCETLRQSQANKAEIRAFAARKEGKSLEEYLHESAWDDDEAGNEKVYIVRDTEAGNGIALFFSLKCGLIFDQADMALSEEENSIVEAIAEAIRARDEEAVEKYHEYCAGFMEQGRIEELFHVAFRKVEEDTEKNSDSIRVKKSYPAMELSILCRNENYRNPISGIPLGVGIFWKIIAPLVCRISNAVGCRYLYLFAADQTYDGEGDAPGEKKLIRHYKSGMRFESMSGKYVIKPDFDRNLPCLIQEIGELEGKRKMFWESFSDLDG